MLESTELFEFWERFYGQRVRTFDYKWLRAVANEEFTGCHYDVVYMGRGSRRLHTCWLPIADLSIEQGTLCICVGSHNLPGFARLHETYGNMDVDRDLVDGWFSSDPREITEKFGGYWATTNFRAGDMLAFGLFTMHASTTNMTDRWRLSCDVRYQPAADSVDERWIGETPIAHYAWNKPDNKLIAMSEARQNWGV
jgi:ectoine hydroxylase-related dioxygenase (phytanoyl-CoA dioxygenase family)